MKKINVFIDIAGDMDCMGVDMMSGNSEDYQLEISDEQYTLLKGLNKDELSLEDLQSLIEQGHANLQELVDKIHVLRRELVLSQGVEEAKDNMEEYCDLEDCCAKAEALGWVKPDEIDLDEDDDDYDEAYEEWEEEVRESILEFVEDKTIWQQADILGVDTYDYDVDYTIVITME